MMKGRHDWKWFEAAKEITDSLLESELIDKDNPWKIAKIRGMIQIILEEKY